MLVPEFARSARRDDARPNFIFEFISGSEGRDGDVLFLGGGVRRRVARSRNGDICCCVRAGSDYRPIGFVDTHEANIDLFVGRVVAEDELAQLLCARFALHADAHRENLFAGAVVFKARGRGVLVDHKGLVRIVRGSLLRGRLRLRCC